MDDDHDDKPKTGWQELKGGLSKVFHFAHNYWMPFAMLTVGLAIVGPAAASTLAGSGSVALLDPFAHWLSMFVPDPAGLSYVGDYASSSWSNLLDGTLISDNAVQAFNGHAGGHGLAEMASHGAEHVDVCTNQFGEWIDELSPERFEVAKGMAESSGSMMDFFIDEGLCIH